MKLLRERIWPVLKAALVVVVIAVLVKIAFFPDGGSKESDALPSGGVVEPTIQASRTTVTNDITVKATVREGDTVSTKSTAQGTISELYVAEGGHVELGQIVAEIRSEKPRDPVVGADGVPRQQDPEVTYREVSADASGTVTSLPVVDDQPVQIGDTLVQIVPSAYWVSATIPPAQLYRLASEPKDGEVTIDGGPAPFTCTDLRIRSGAAANLGPGASSGATGGGAAGAAAAAGAGAGGAAAGGSSAVGGDSTSVRCRVPAEVKVFPGLEATLVIHAGTAADVLAIPTTAVKGGGTNGVVTVVAADGSRQERTIELGLSDGTLVEVRSGLDGTETILEFVPGTPEQLECPPMDGSAQFDPATVDPACFAQQGLGS